MLITYGTIINAVTVPTLLYSQNQLQEPSITFQGIDFNLSEGNISPVDTSTGFFSTIVTEYNNEITSPQTVDMILVLPRSNNTTKFLPVSSQLGKIAILQSTTNTDFILYHRSSTSTIGGIPGNSVGANYGSNDLGSWIDFQDFPELVAPSVPYVKSIIDDNSQEFGNAEFLLIVGSDFYTVLSTYAYDFAPKIETLKIGIFNSADVSFTSDVIYHQSTGNYPKTIGSNEITMPSAPIYLRSVVFPDSSQDGEFSDFNSTGTSVDLIIRSSTILNSEILEVPRYLKGKSEFNVRKIGNGIVSLEAEPIQYYLNGKMQPAIVENDGKNRNFVNLENIDVYYMISEGDSSVLNHGISDGGTFVDDIVEIQAKSSKVDVIQYLTTGPGNQDPNREGKFSVNINLGVSATYYTTLEWNNVRLEKVGIRGKNGAIREIVFDEKDSFGNYIYANDKFNFGYTGPSKKSSLRVGLKQVSGVSKVVIILDQSNVSGKFSFEYIEISQEPTRSIGKEHLITVLR